ncbi:restriction endonuclease subunit S [Bifidobacterium pseudolongum subsp. pseudolongum]|nr:restriction endonuclease subunit S [Bifidobacterium pseudolongum subsp. pseudolongum]
MGKKLQPKLRFKGFTDDWEQRPFGKVYTRCTEKNNPIRFGVDKIITVASMQYAPRHGCTNNEYLLTYNVMKLGDIAFEGHRNKRFPFGRFVENMIGEGIVSHVFSVYRPIVKQSSLLFLKYYINNDYVIRNMLRKSTIAATMMRTLVDADLMRQTLTLPSGREQEKIGKLFVDIDNLIDAEKRKLRLLQERKRSLLKGIFNRTIRFEGFTGVWKQQKLKDEAISISAGGDIDREKLLPSGRYPVIGNALSNNGIIGYYANDYEVKGPAVTVTGRGEVGVAKAREMNFTPVVRLLVIKSLHDSHFLECAINLHRAPLESTGVPQLTIPIISNYKLLFPPTLMEEMSIGLLFKHIDSLIAAVFLKIELLNLKKQSLLQQMFV